MFQPHLLCRKGFTLKMEFHRELLVRLFLFWLIFTNKVAYHYHPYYHYYLTVTVTVGKISNASLGIMTLLFVFCVSHTNMNDKIFRSTKYLLKWFETVCNWIFHLFSVFFSPILRYFKYSIFNIQYLKNIQYFKHSIFQRFNISKIQYFNYSNN